MFRRNGGGRGRGKTLVPVSTSTGNELPVDGVVRVTKVDRIQAYNLVSRPSEYRAVSVAAAAGPAESLAVNVVRVGDVGDTGEHDGFVKVPVDGVVRVTKADRIHAYNLVSRPSVYRAVSVAAASGPAESLAVSVVRVGHVGDGEHDGFVKVSVT
ncbi:unnamed protein product [Alopecurus aequalis]